MASNKIVALPRHCRSGFTLTELAISLAVAAVAVLISMTVGMQMTGQMSGEKTRIDSQDNARIALDEIARMLRGSGSQVDFSRGQKSFVFAGPYTVAINANLFPIDDASGLQAPLAVDPELADATVPLGGGETYTPTDAYETGAETIVITVDSDRDGYVTTTDTRDDEEEDSANPRDFVVKGFVYGSDGAANVVEEHELAMIRGPVAAPDGSQPAPLFQYWLDADNDRETPPVLHGDVDSDGELSALEVSSLTAVPAGALGLIEKIDVTATSETRSAEGDQPYGKVEMQSSVTFRNRNFSAARILGTVFHDVDQDGVRDTGEVPLRDVLIRCSNGFQTRTTADGRYWFVLNPGTYTVEEVDPVGVSSTTPNSVPVEAGPDEYVHVDFGDTYSAGQGTIRGIVYEDGNVNGRRDAGEIGIAGANVFLDTGAATLTDSTGAFLFAIGVGNYTVTESDLEGYASTTPNVVDVNIAASGDSAWVSFGDHIPEKSGRIKGIVYFDVNRDGVRDNLEPGIPGVNISVDETDFTITDNNGEFAFTVAPGEHTVTETDPPAHTSSTLNTLNVVVAEDQIVTVEFGDIGQEDVSFQEITLANTERALSIASVQFKEDIRSDIDVVLGTHYVNGSNDILAWWNQRTNSRTPNSGIFSVNPTFQRVVSADVNALAIADLNNDGCDDVIAALGATSNNLAVWLTQTSGNNAGKLNTAPEAWYSASGATSVLDVVAGKFNADGYEDFAVGTKIGPGLGKLEIWLGSGAQNFAMSSVYYGLGSTSQLGEVTALAAADFNRDGIDDLVVGTASQFGGGKVHLALNNGSAAFTAMASLSHDHRVEDVLALDMKEDDQNDMDIVVATSSTDIAGQISVWHNRGSFFGRLFAPNGVPNDLVNPGGAPLSLVAVNVDNDVFPDIITGTRTSNTYTGQVVVYRSFGFLSSQGTVISNSTVGEVITITAGDFNKDGAPDLATGTRVSGSTGKVVIYFNTITSS